MLVNSFTPATLFAVLTLAVVVPARVTTQDPTPRTRSTSAVDLSAPARTAKSGADFQGVWSFATATPLQRPPQFADKPSLTDDEAAQFMHELASRSTDVRGVGRVPKCPVRRH